MNRKQLEECAWKKTPKDERRATRESYDWKTKKTITSRLKGNAREVRVFDPSGDTPGTMSPWVPLWSLYGDELEQRCKEEREPKLRAPYNRMRADYTGDVESSPGTKATREGASRHHATKKKSAAQLEREIAEALAKPLEGFKIGDVVQFRWEPDTGGVIRSLTSDGSATVMTPRGERALPTTALSHMHKAHVERMRRSVEASRAAKSHATKKTPRRGAPKFTKFDERHDIDWFPLWKFREMVVDGRIFDEDGSGKYGKLSNGQRMVSNVKVDLSRFATSQSFDRRVPSWATGVVWSFSRRNA